MNFSLLYEKQRSVLGLVTLDVLLREDLELPSVVTQYPVEDGGPEISDHITQGNESLSIDGKVTSGNMEAFEFGSCTSKLLDIIETFRDMHKSRKAITVVTGIGVYTDMGFNGVTLSRNNTDGGGNWLNINARLLKVVKAELQEGELPPDIVAEDVTGKAGKTEASAGGAGSTNSGNQSPPPSNASQKTAALSMLDKFGYAPAP